MPNPVQYSDLFDKDGIILAIQQMEAAEKDFGKTVLAVNSKIKASYRQVETEIKNIQKALLKFDINPKNAIAQLAALEKQLDDLIRKGILYRETSETISAVHHEVSQSVKVLRAENRGLITEYDKLSVKVREQRVRIAEMAEQLRKQRREIKQLTDLMRINTRQVSAAAGTYNRLNIETREMIKQLKAMPGAFNPVTGAINRNNREALRLQRQIQANQKVLKQFDAEIGVFNRNVGNYRSGLQGLQMGFTRLTATVGGAITLFYALEPIFRTTLNLDRFSKSLEIVSGDSVTLAENQAFLARTAHVYGLEVLSLTDSYVRFAAATNDTNLEGDRAREIFAQTSSVISRLNLSVEDTNGLFRAFEQIISKGKLQAEELRLQLGDRIPGAFALAAKAMGVTRAELDQMLKDGKVLAEDFLPAFAKELQRSFGGGAEYVDTLQASVNRLKNAFTDIVDDADTQSIFGGLINSFTALLYTVDYYITPALKRANEQYEQQKILVGDLQTEIYPLLNEYDQLAAKSKLSADEQSRMEEIIIAVGDAIPGAKLKINEYGEALQINAGYAREFVAQNQLLFQAMHRQAKMEVDQSVEELTNTYAKLLYAQQNGLILNKSTNEYLERESIPDTETYNLLLDQQAKYLLETEIAYRKALARQRELDAQGKDLTKTASDAVKVQGELSEEITHTTEESVNSKNALDALRAALKALEDQIEDLAGRGIAIPDAMAMRWREVSSSISRAVSAVEDFKDLNDTVVETGGLSRSATGVSGAGSPHVSPRFDVAEGATTALGNARLFNTQQLLDAIIAAEQAGQRQITDIYRNELARRLAMGKDNANLQKKTIADLVEFSLQSAEELGSLLFENAQARLENELSMLNIQREKELEIAGENEEAKAAIRARYIEEERELKIRQARQDKAQAIFSIAINTAQAVMSTLGQTGFFGIPLAAIVGAIGAAQLAIVAARPLPQFYKGTQNSPEGPAEVAEYGPELIVSPRGEKRIAEKRQVTWLEKGSKVYTASQTKKILEQSVLDGGRTAEIHQRVANEVQEAKRIEVEHTMSAAFERAIQIGNHELAGAVERAVSKIPINQITMDERGFTKSIRKQNTKIVELKSRYSLK